MKQKTNKRSERKKDLFMSLKKNSSLMTTNKMTNRK